MAIVLAELVDMVRSEANIEGFKEMTNLIVNILNQELQRFTGKGKFEELRTDLTVDLSADEQFQIPLPADFQLFGAITYYKSGDLTTGLQLSKGQGFGYQEGLQGTPRYFTRYGNSYINVYPALGTLLEDRLVLSYYKKPQMLLDTDPLQVPSLETAVVQATIGRMLRMTSTQRAQLATREAHSAFNDARAQNAGG